MAKTCDPKCYDLAQDWLDQEDNSKLTALAAERRKVDLGCAIQRAIEYWLMDEQMEAEAARDAAVDQQIDARRG